MRKILDMGSSVYKITTIFITLNNPESSRQQVLTQIRPRLIEGSDAGFTLLVIPLFSLTHLITLHDELILTFGSIVRNLGDKIFDGNMVNVHYTSCTMYHHYTSCTMYKAPRQECITENYFSYFSTKTYVVGTQKNRLDETVLLSTQNT